MNLLRVFAGLAAAFVFTNIAAVGCGGDTNEDPAVQTVDGGDGSILEDGTATQDGAATNDGSPFADGGPPPIEACRPAGAACQTGLQCCTYACTGGTCSAKQCVADNATCATDQECCGGKCTAGKCAPLSGSCKTAGNPCAGNTECCSKFCSGGICSGSPSYCRQTGDACSADLECCGGLCEKQAGAALGLCKVASASGAGNCLNAGQVCGAGAAYDGGVLEVCGGECCSRSCRPYADTGVLICQPPTGCHPTGEICQTDVDCCGSSTLPNGNTAKITCSKAAGATAGRCDKGNACTPAGGICRLQAIQCNENANCCSGNVLQHNTCKQDNLGIPRCLAAEVDCTAAPATFVGKACASSADCCNLPCVPNPTGNPPFICGATACITQGGACTTTADCCGGSPCVVAPGSTKGTCGAGTPSPTDGGANDGSTTDSGGPPPPPPCSAYGQLCAVSGDCCNGIPCTNGRCIFPIK